MIEEANRFKEILASNFEIDDWEAVDVLLGFVMAHRVPHTEMLWLKLIGASGTGKTEILRAIQELDFATEAEHITPAALRGGYKPRSGRSEPLLLERINGKLVVTKEFAVLLTVRKDFRTEVFGLLRSVYDGALSSDFGSREGHLYQQTRFDWLIGTTPYVETQRQLETQLGSRTIDLRWSTPDNGEALAEKAIANDPRLGTIRDNLARELKVMVSNITPQDRPQMPYLAEIASFVARYRTPVMRDSRIYEIMETPAIESPARVAQALARLGAGLYSLGIENLKPYIVRIGLDTIPKTRANIVRALLKGIRGREEMARYCGISTRALDYVREEMAVLGFEENSDLQFLDGGNEVPCRF